MPDIYGKGYEMMYAGSYGPLEPNYGELFTGYRVPFGRIATETWGAADRAQVREVTDRLSEGIKAVELKAMSSDILERIPKGVGGMKEIEQLGKLTGAEFILHGPQDIDPAGFTREGRWSETSKSQAEIHLKNVIDRAHELSPKGAIPVVQHATMGIPSSEWRPIEGKPEMQTMAVVDRESGALTGVERQMRYVPREEIITPERALDMKNTTEWSDQLVSRTHFKAQADEAMERALPIAPRYEEIMGKATRGEAITAEEQAMIGQLMIAQEQYKDLDAHLASLYNRAYKAKLDDAGDNPQKIAEAKAELEAVRNKFRQAEEMIGKKPFKATEAYRELILNLNALNPKLYIPAEQFALKHAKDNIAGAALHGYQKYGDKAPILAVENFFPGTVFSRADQLKGLIQESRKSFVKKATEAGISSGEAEDAAKKLIGATWDVGHIHMIKKYGFPKELTIEETKKIAPFVKHVHISDNFGFEDSHLPPGMGEVPIKEMLKELEKAGFKGKEVLEAGGFIQQFKKSPTPYSLEALGSPLYAAYMQPFWNQVRGSYGVPAGYFGGYGMMLPEQHFGIYGAGFSTLPLELGGQMPGKGRQFAGAPME